MATLDRVILEYLETHATLTSDNPTLGLGQKVIVTGITGAIINPNKIGDNSNAYNSLPFNDPLFINISANLDLTIAPYNINGNIVNVVNTDSSTHDIDIGSTVKIGAGDTLKFIRVSGSWIYNGIQHYDTGWINRSDWTNVHLGTVATKNTDSNVAHNLGGNISELIVKVFVSTDGTDNNSFEVGTSNYTDDVSGVLSGGFGIDQVDTNELIIQTGVVGLLYTNSVGNSPYVDTEDWYYKVVVTKSN
jgi:hypothetical protein